MDACSKKIDLYMVSQDCLSTVPGNRCFSVATTLMHVDMNITVVEVLECLSGGGKALSGSIEMVGPKPSPKHSLDRIDGNGWYARSNVRWATYTEQNRNTSRNIVMTLDGVSKTLPEWCELLGFGYTTLLVRRQRGWTDERALTQPVQQRRK